MSTGWVVTDASRTDLLARFLPHYPNVVAHHVTLPGQSEKDGLPAPATFAIVGRADDGHGVEAMVVSRDGNTGRTDGGTWHITWSLGEGREAGESNDVIAARGFEPLAGGAVETVPGRWH